MWYNIYQIQITSSVSPVWLACATASYIKYLDDLSHTDWSSCATLWCCDFQRGLHCNFLSTTSGIEWIMLGLGGRVLSLFVWTSKCCSRPVTDKAITRNHIKWSIGPPPFRLPLIGLPPTRLPPTGLPPFGLRLKPFGLRLKSYRLPPFGLSRMD